MTDDPKSYKFIKETIKKDGNKKRPLWFYILIYIGAAIVFGLIASVVVALTQPYFSEAISGGVETNKVDIPKDENPETTKEDGSESTSTSAQSTSDSSSGSSSSSAVSSSSSDGTSTDSSETDVESEQGDNIEDHKTLYQDIFASAETPKHSLVTVTGIKSQMDYFNQNYESQQQLSGFLAAENGQDLFILTEYRVVDNVERIQVTMYDGSIVDATFQKRDKNTGLAILKVPLSNLSAGTREGMVIAPFGNSYGIKQGEPILAVGNPNGYGDAVAYGVVTSVTNKIQTVDNEYNLLTTDIIGSKEGSGILVNLDGEIVGVIAQSFGNDDNNIVVALSVSQIKNLIERLSNDEQLPYIGITGRNVTTEIADRTGIPQGVLITATEADSPAMVTGIKEFDVIVKFGDEKVSTLNQYHDKLDKCEVGEKKTIVAMRKGAEGYVEVKFDVTIGER